MWDTEGGPEAFGLLTAGFVEVRAAGVSKELP